MKRAELFALLVLLEKVIRKIFVEHQHLIWELHTYVDQKK